VRTPVPAARRVTVIGVPLLVAGTAAVAAPLTANAAATRTMPAASSAISGQLSGVAVTSASNAWAVGSAGTTHATTLIMRWNGKTWRRVASPSPAGSTLRGVAATSARSAWAVGSTGSGKALIVHWNGTAWKRVTSPGNGLSGVAATSARNAWAVGSTSSGKTLIVHWNGTTWKRVTSPSPSQARFSGLTAVTATSARNAWAVGSTTTSTNFKSLILRWNGRAWRQVPSPSVTFGKFGSALEGVAATSVANAWAVGCTDGCPVGGTPLIERWRGTSWKQVAAPTTPYALYNLVGVAATSASSAWTVGGGGPVTSEAAATAHWNGHKWTLSHGRSGAGLAGVAAISATNAWAVGGTAKGRTLILHWNGTTWKVS
jgi:hypothetical protein